MRDGTMKFLAALATLALVGGAPALAAKGGNKGGGGGGGGKPAEPAADPAISFLRITSQNEYGFNQTGSLWVANADGSNVSLIVGAQCGRAGWSPDLDPATPGYQGKLAFGSDVNGIGLYVSDPDGGNLTRIVETDYPPLRTSWSSNHRIAYQTKVDNDGDGTLDRQDIFIVDTDGNLLLRLTDTRNDSERSPSWSPDGTRLVYTSTRDVGTERLTDAFVVTLTENVDGTLSAGTPQQITGFDPALGGDVGSPEWARTKNEVVIQDHGSSGYGDLWIIDLASDETIAAPSPLTDAYQQLLVHNATACWSPDDTKILFSADNDIYPFGSLWTIDADGTNKTELIRRGRGQDAGTKAAPSWRPSD